jgi:hypothetical protein
VRVMFNDILTERALCKLALLKQRLPQSQRPARLDCAEGATKRKNSDCSSTFSIISNIVNQESILAFSSNASPK